MLKFEPPKELENRFALYVYPFEGAYPQPGRLIPTRTEGLAKRLWWYFGMGRRSRVLQLIDGEWFTLYENMPEDRLPAWYQKVDVAPYWRNGKFDPAKADRNRDRTKEEYAEWRIQVYREQAQDQRKMAVVPDANLPAHDYGSAIPHGGYTLDAFDVPHNRERSPLG